MSLLCSLQAQLLDTDEKHVEQIKHCLKRSTLRAQIYVEPDTSIDKAAKIIEQVIAMHATRNEVHRVASLAV